MKTLKFIVEPELHVISFRYYNLGISCLIILIIYIIIIVFVVNVCYNFNRSSHRVPREYSRKINSEAVGVHCFLLQNRRWPIGVSVTREYEKKEKFSRPWTTTLNH